MIKIYLNLKTVFDYNEKNLVEDWYCCSRLSCLQMYKKTVSFFFPFSTQNKNKKNVNTVLERLIGGMFAWHA